MKLSDVEILTAKNRIPNWEYDSYAETIKRIFIFSDFKEAIVFVNKVAKVAEENNHHPNIAIEYNKVTLFLTTHDEGGVTEKDIALAAAIDIL